MKSQIKQEEIDIAAFYALDIKALWRGFKKEHLSFWLLCIYFFFEYIRPQSLYPALDVFPWAQAVLLSSLVAVFFDRSVRWVSSIENKLLMLFSFIVILSGIFAFIPSISWDYRNVMLGWLLVYFLMINIVNSEKRLIIFLLLYFLFNLKMAQHGTVGWILRGFSFADIGLIGAPGWFRNSGEYAIQMLIYGSLSIAFIVPLKKYWGLYKRWFLYAAAGAGFIAVMGASSRGAQIGLAAIGIWWFFRQKGGFKALGLLVLVSIVLFILLPEEQIQRFSDMGKDESSLQRLAYVEYGMQIMREYPLLGVGYKNWLPYLTYSVPDGLGPMEKVQVPHNIYIEVGAEIGIPALFIFMLMALFLFIINARTRTVAKKLDNRLLFYLAYGLDAGLIGYLVAGSFVTVFFYPFFWVQMAMIVMVNTIAKQLLMGIEKPIKSRVGMIRQPTAAKE